MKGGEQKTRRTSCPTRRTDGRTDGRDKTGQDRTGPGQETKTVRPTDRPTDRQTDRHRHRHRHRHRQRVWPLCGPYAAPMPPLCLYVRPQCGPYAAPVSVCVWVCLKYTSLKHVRVGYILYARNAVHDACFLAPHDSALSNAAHAAYGRCASENILASADDACRRPLSFLRMMHHCIMAPGFQP